MTDVPFEREAKITSNVKTMVGAVMGLIVGVFGAGVYWHQTEMKLQEAYDKAISADKQATLLSIQLSELKQRIEGLKEWGPQQVMADNLVNPQPASNCPQGSYVIGFTATYNGDHYATGVLNGLRPRCAPVNVR